MPSKSKSQQSLMGMAYAVRKGELDRSKVDRNVLDIADSNITTTDLKHFAETKRKHLPDHLKERLEDNLGTVTFYFRYTNKVGHEFTDEVEAPYLLAAKQIFIKSHPDCEISDINI